MDFDSIEYKRSRVAYMMQCTFEYFVTILVADAFLAKLLSSLGIGDALIGIISSFVTFAFLFQLAAVFFASKIRNVKRTVIFFSTLSQLLFMCLYLLPFLPFSQSFSTILVILCVLTAYFGNYFVASMLYKWGNSFVNPLVRGDFSAKKEIISLVSGMIFTLIVGVVLDRYEAMGRLENGFLFTAIAIFILSACNFVSLILIKKSNEKVEEEKEVVPIKEVLRNIFCNKNFRNVIILDCLKKSATYMTAGFLGIYKTGDLLFSLGTIQIINIAGNLCRVLVSVPFGKYSDRTSYAKGIKLAMYLR